MDESGKNREVPAWALRDAEPPEEVMEKLVDCLYGLRMKYGLQEVPYWVPFDGPERRDWINYIPFAWAPPIGEILDRVGEYVRAKKKRKTLSKSLRDCNPKKEIEDLYKAYSIFLQKFQQLSTHTRNALEEAGFGWEQALQLNNCIGNLYKPFHRLPNGEQARADMVQIYWERNDEALQEGFENDSLEEIVEEYFVRELGPDYQTLAPMARLQRAGRGRPNEPEKKKLLERLVQIVRHHIDRIPSPEDMESLCKSLFGPDCAFDAESAVRRAFNDPLPSEVLAWFSKRGIYPDSIPEGTSRWSLFAEACADLYDRPARLRRGAPPLTEEAKKKLYRDIWTS